MLDEDRTDLGYTVGDTIDVDLMGWMTETYRRLIEYGDTTSKYTALKLNFEILHTQYYKRLKSRDASIGEYKKEIRRLRKEIRCIKAS